MSLDLDAIERALTSHEVSVDNVRLIIGAAPALIAEIHRFRADLAAARLAAAACRQVAAEALDLADRIVDEQDEYGRIPPDAHVAPLRARLASQDPARMVALVAELIDAADTAQGCGDGSETRRLTAARNAVLAALGCDRG